jgi:hypothetical protein
MGRVECVRPAQPSPARHAIPATTPAIPHPPRAGGRGTVRAVRRRRRRTHARAVRERRVGSLPLPEPPLRLLELRRRLGRGLLLLHTRREGRVGRGPRDRTAAARSRGGRGPQGRAEAEAKPACCAKHAKPSSCCETEPEVEPTATEPESPGVRWIAGSFAQKCRGETPAGMLKLEVSVPPVHSQDVRVSMPECGDVVAPDSHPFSILPRPPVPPPRVS